MKSFIKKTSLAIACFNVLAISVTAQTTTPATPRAEYAMLNQPICQFKAYGKPYMLTYKPASNKFEVIVFGTQDQSSQSIKNVQNADDYEFLTPIRYTLKFVDNNIQIDKIYEGWRESYIGKGLEKSLKLLGMLPKNTYKGNPFVKNMLKNKIPTQLAFENTETLSAFIRHLKHAVLAENITPANTDKPLLLIQFEEPNQIISQDDVLFLTTYWELVNPQDTLAVKFFNTMQDKINDARSTTSGAKTVGQSGTEIVFGAIEKDTNDFKGKENMAAITKTVIVAATILPLQQMFKAWTTGIEKNNTTKISNEIKTAYDDLKTQITELWKHQIEKTKTEQA